MILVAGVGDQFEFSPYQNLTTMLFASQNGAQTNRWSSWSHRELFFFCLFLPPFYVLKVIVYCLSNHYLEFDLLFDFFILLFSFIFSQVLFSSNISSIVFVNLYWFFIFIRVYTCHPKEKKTMTTIIKVQYL